MKIILTFEYEDGDKIHPEIIADDFRRNPTDFLGDDYEIEVEPIPHHKQGLTNDNSRNERSSSKR